MSDNNVEIIGYSERGIVSSLMYEIVMGDDSLNLFKELISYCEPMFLSENTFPLKNIDKITKFKVFLEHSLSQFGDPDVILFINTQDEKKSSYDYTHCIFVEAKISNNQGNKSLLKHFQAFNNIDKKNRDKHREGKDKEKNSSFSSNLFTQLFHKNLLINAILSKCGDNEDIENGITPPDSSTGNKRKIGSNAVVHKILEEIKMVSEHGQVWYLALVPDGTLLSVDEDLHVDYRSNQKYKWDFEHYGYITWETIEKFCRDKNKHFKHTIRVFEHNCPLIFSKSSIKNCTNKECIRTYISPNDGKYNNT